MTDLSWFFGNNRSDDPLENFFDDRVEYWHNQYKGPKPLQEFMGMNDKEWRLFVQSPSRFYKTVGESVRRYIEEQ